jgi:hypothetical protein
VRDLVPLSLSLLHLISFRFLFSSGNAPITGKVKIPDNVKCERCTISWSWKGGNDLYTNCADVRILAADGSGSSLATNGTDTTDGKGLSKTGAVILTIFLTSLFLVVIFAVVAWLLIKKGKLALSFGSKAASNDDYIRA